MLQTLQSPFWTSEESHGWTCGNESGQELRIKGQNEA